MPSTFSKLSPRSRAERLMVWVRRRGWRDNITVMSESELSMGTVSRAKLLEASRLLEYGADICETLGPTAKHVQFATIKTIHATVGGNELVINHDKKLRSQTTRIRLPNSAAQLEALEAAEERLGEGTQLLKSRPNRFLYALKPFNTLVTLLLIGAAFSVLAENKFALRERHGEMVWTQRVRVFYVPGDPFYRPPTIGDFPLAIGLTTTGVLLNTLGYPVTMGLLGAGATLATLWTAKRLAQPPMILSLVAKAPVMGELELAASAYR